VGAGDKRHALLGLLHEGPASGYDLMQIFKLSLRGQARSYLTWLAGQAAEEAARLGELEASKDWDNDDLARYGRLVLEYGKRLEALNEEWATWAAAWIPADDGVRATGARP